jgi:multicomponent Na+:H+ antiporter subunit A
LGRFYAFLFAFMASMLGLVTADNLILLFVFWELTSITSYLLIGFDHEREDARAAALQALLVTGLGGLTLLAGFVILGVEAETFRLSELANNSELIVSSGLFGPIVVLILLGAGTKSAQFPFHFWLPNAMAAPAPVSAYLHSSTMVKAGVFLLAKLHPAFMSSDLWRTSLIILGTITAVYAGILAVRSTKFKGILAATTVSALGTMVVLVGATNPGESALPHFIIAHAFYKGCLFMAAGGVERVFHIKDTEAAAGVGLRSPALGLTLLLGSLSMVGVPLFLGSAAKDLTKDALDSAPFGELASISLIATGALFAFAAIAVGVRPLVGPTDQEPDRNGFRHLLLVLPPLSLSVLGLVAVASNIAPLEWLVRGGTRAVAGGLATDAAPIAFGDSKPIAWLTSTSAVAAAVGAGLFLSRSAWRPALDKAGELIAPASPPALYRRTLQTTLGAASAITATMQSGSIGRYIRIILIATLLLVGGVLVRDSVWIHIDPPDDGMTPFDLVLVALIVAATTSAAVFKKRLASVAALGAIGTAISLMFVKFGAPDVAMTQFSVETLTVLVFVLAFYDLPQFRRLTGGPMRIYELTLAAAFGTTMTVLLLLSASKSLSPPVSAFFSENAVDQAFGRNIVNVILVDFRATDTFGEILVLSLSAIGITALLKQRTNPDNEGDRT